MSIAHRRLTRTVFGNRRPQRCGYHVAWGSGKKQVVDGVLCSTEQAWYVDDAGAVRLREVLTERGGWSVFKRVRSIGVDLGGIICTDHDRQVSVYAGGYLFRLWEHQRGDLLDILTRSIPATDCPAVMVIPGHWWRVFLQVEVALALRDELQKQRNDAARQLAQRDQHVAGVRDQINKKLDAQGAKVRLVW